MKIAVVGLWHLGSVTAACLADASFTTLGYDPDRSIITHLQQGSAPLFEPGLDDLIAAGLESKRLTFSGNQQDLSDSDLIWITFDTPVDDNDIADVAFVTTQIVSLLPLLKDNCVILISSQIPVGTTRKLIEYATANWPQKNICFAVCPENLRLGKAIDVFKSQERIVVGIDDDSAKELLTALLQPFTEQIIWMSIPSAEMTKHALNSFLATSVVFVNELATLCEQVGADAREVEAGLKSEARIGKKAYLRPGSAIAGGTLLRDVNYLVQLGKTQQQGTPFFSALLKSNDEHKKWTERKLAQLFSDFNAKKISILGLTYKAGTDTLRRSHAIEICTWLHRQGASVTAYDPAITELPADLTQYINLTQSSTGALEDADAVVIATECPEFTSLTANHLTAMKNPIVLDASGFLHNQLGMVEHINYFSVGSK